MNPTEEAEEEAEENLALYYLIQVVNRIDDLPDWVMVDGLYKHSPSPDNWVWL